ncbi:MAG: hypothetical protein OSJ73_15360 [Lachnospiraceae bacterium]|nr:hypothetical protein [Lachnospiraceae bacterium]
MRKTYKCSNIKFCMEDENQRRTWEYLQGITRKDGSYGKILSDAFAVVLDGKNGTNAGECSIVESKQSEQELRKVEELLEGLLEDKLRRLQEDLTEQIEKCFQNCDFSSSASIAKSLEMYEANSMDQMQEPELSEDMMAFAFAMGG